MGLRSAPVRGVVPVYPDRFAAVGFFRWYQRLAHNLIPPLCVAAAVALYGDASRRVRALLGLAALAAAVAVVFTLSRMAWLSLVVGLLVVVVNVAGRARRWAVGAVLVASLAMLLHPGVQARLRWSSVSGINDDRKAIWNVCRVVVSEHPLTGVGWGNLPKRALPLYDRLTPPEGMRAWCHDAFLSAWAEGGPVLFLALVAFWALLLRAFWRSARVGDRMARAASAGALGALVAMLLNSLVHDIFYSSEAVYGLGFAVAIAAALARPPRAGGASVEPGGAAAP
jgi:O-antigen ligase